MRARWRSLGEQVTLLSKPFRLLDLLAALGGPAEPCVPFSGEAALLGGSPLGLQDTDELIGDGLDCKGAKSGHLVSA